MPVQFIMQAGELLGRRVTSPWRTFPNLFIIGAPKAGTTSLASYIGVHPSYVSALTKEITFLQHIPELITRFQRNKIHNFLWQQYADGKINRYKKFFPLKSEMERVSQNTNARSYTGDHTPIYMYCPKAMQIIKEYSPDAKIIVMLRNPIDRVYSHYTMGYRFAMEKRPFDTILQEEMRTGKAEKIGRRYVYQSAYAPHIKRLKEMLREDQLMIIQSELFYADPQKTVNEVFKFLELPPATIDAEIRNQGVYKEKLLPETRARMKEFFRPYNEELYALLGKDLNWQ